MAKLDGIDPRAGRKTLGQAMKDLIAADQVDPGTEAAHNANHGDVGKDSQTAKGVLGRNTYPSSINSLQESSKAVPNNDANTLNQGLTDIAPAGIKALQDVAHDVMVELNEYTPGEIHAESTGGRRGDEIPSAQTNEAETFVKKLLDVTGNGGDLAVGAFESLSGGGSDSADNISVASKQGGFFTAKQIQLLVDKLSGTEDSKKRSLLLANIGGENVSNPNSRPGGAVAQYVHDNLDRKNRYAPSLESPYIKNPKSQDEKVFFKDGLYSIQTGSGRLGIYDKDGKGVHTIDLSQMAMQLMVRAQSHTDLAGMIDEGFAKGQAGAGSFLFDLAALLPGVTQIGAARVAQNAMRIKTTQLAESKFGAAGADGQDDIFPVDSGDVILGAGPSSETAGTLDSRSAGSYGNMNSFVEPFAGGMPFGMFFIVLYSIIGTLLLALILEGIKGTITIDPKYTKSLANISNPATLQLGFNSRGGGGDDISSLFFSLFGLPRLDFPPGMCLIRGIERFYDIPSLQDLISGAAGFDEVLESAVNLALSPGYYATITKQVLRDQEQITEAILALGQNASVFNVIAGIFKIVEVLFSSFSFRYTVFLKTLGNIDLMSRKAFGTISTGDLVAPVDDRNKAANAALPKTPYTRMRLSRFGASSNPLGLSFFPSVFNINTFSMRQSLGGSGFTEVSKDTLVDAKTIVSDVSRGQLMSVDRISKKQLQAVEDALDVEYMPFYLHDLRTDELFSLPAFINSFTEDYSPEYNESHGYGRTDPVLIYSKTRRNMSIDFKLVAFSKADHDYMWFVINKMVAMCYPQRSSGQKRLTDDNKFFIQPFSQVPIASPMVRLRLGELVKSNYSKVSLARFFGLLGAPGRSNIAGELSESSTTPISAQIAAAENQTIYKGKQALYNGEDPGLKMVLLHGQEVKIKVGDSEVYCGIQSTVAGDEVENPGGLVIQPRLVGRATDRRANPLGVTIVATIAELGIFDDIEDAKKKLAPCGAVAVKALFPDDDPLAMDLKNIPTIKVEASLIIADPIHGYGSTYKFEPVSVREKALENIDAIDPSDTANVDFMKAENNPVVASFEANRGRGLAGFITSLALDYNESTWEIDPGNRAPKSVGVSMSFSPIHDLPLGMDADGHLLAPSHPVGSFNMTDPYNEMDASFGKAKPNPEVTEAASGEFAKNLGSRNNVNLD
jgi:hypothetical protein